MKAAMVWEQDGDGWGHHGGIQKLRKDLGVPAQGSLRGLRGRGEVGARLSARGPC